MSEKNKTYKAICGGLRGEPVTIAHIKKLCEVLDRQDEEFEKVKEEVAKLEKTIKGMQKRFGNSIATRQTFGGGWE